MPVGAATSHTCVLGRSRVIDVESFPRLTSTEPGLSGSIDSGLKLSTSEDVKQVVEKDGGETYTGKSRGRGREDWIAWMVLRLCVP